MKPPYESPSAPSRSGSARPSRTTWSSAACTSSASGPPQSPSCGVIHSRAVRAGAADVRQHHPIAAGAQQHDLQARGRRPRASGPPWTSTTVGRAASPAPRRRCDPGLDRTAGPGRLHAAHLGPGEAVDPGGAHRRERTKLARRLDQAQLRRTRADRRRDRHPCAADAHRVRHDVAVSQADRLASGAPGRRVDGEPPGMGAPAVRDQGDHAVGSVPRRAGRLLALPARQVRVGPVADRAIEVRLQRDRRARSRRPARRTGWATGRRRSRDRPRPRRRSTGRPGSTPAAPRAPRARGSPGVRRSTTAASPDRPPDPRRPRRPIRRDRHLPDRRARVEVRVLPGVRDDRDRPPVRPPSEGVHAAGQRRERARCAPPRERPRRTAAGAGRCSPSRPSGSRASSRGGPGAPRPGRPDLGRAPR